MPHHLALYFLPQAQPIASRSTTQAPELRHIHQTGHVRLDTSAVTKLYHVTVKVDHCGMENAAVHHGRYVNEH